MACNCGVYRITAPDGREYLGSTSRDFATRWREHRHGLRHGMHVNRALQNIAAKHGVGALKFEILLVCAPRDVVFYEQLAIDALKPALNGTPVAGSTLGYRHTTETKARFPLRRKAGPVSEEGMAARVQGLKTWAMSATHRAAITQAKGRAVVCIETDERFPSSCAAAKWLRENRSPKAKSTNVAWAADGKFATAYGFTWKRP